MERGGEGNVFGSASLWCKQKRIEQAKRIGGPTICKNCQVTATTLRREESGRVKSGYAVDLPTV